MQVMMFPESVVGRLVGRWTGNCSAPGQGNVRPTLCHSSPLFVVVMLWCVLRPQLTLPYVLNICVQLTSGLRHLHAACGVLHRDLKTDNALVAGKDPLVVKWADFGCSVKLTGGPTSSAGGSTYGKGGCVLAERCACRLLLPLPYAHTHAQAHTRAHPLTNWQTQNKTTTKVSLGGCS